MHSIFKYLLEGLAVAVAAHFVGGKKLVPEEVILLGLTAAVTFLVLDHYTPHVAAGARHGAGFGIGSQLTEGYSDEEEAQLEWEPEPELVDADQEAEVSVPEDPAYGPVESASSYKPANFSPPTNESVSMPEYSRPAPPTGITVLEPSGKPYRLIDGVYSAKAVLAGYSENVVPHNSQVIRKLVKWPWSPNHQSGGTIGGACCGRKQEGGAGCGCKQSGGGCGCKQSGGGRGCKQSGGGCGCGCKQDGGAAPTIHVTPKEPVYHRVADALYSGDLVNIISGANVLQRGSIDSQVIFDKPISVETGTRTNLSKLRIVAPVHKPAEQKVINYGDKVHIMHNSYYNNTNMAKYIKYGERLQSHQEGPLFRSFKVYDAANPGRKGHVEPGTDIHLVRGDQEGTKIYLKIETDKSVSSSSVKGDASVFTVETRRVYEEHGKNLCVCPGEILYP